MDGGVGAFEDTEITDPINKVNRNIENAPLIKDIKNLELRLLDAMKSNDSVMNDILEIEDEIDGKHADVHKEDKNLQKQILQELLGDFRELLETKYGALGYLVSSTSADIEKLYGIDTDREYYCMVDGSRIRVPNRNLDSAIERGGGRRWLGERSLIISNPSESTANAKITDHAVNEIIDAIQKKLHKLSE